MTHHASALFSRIDDEKRERILNAAIGEFTAHGFGGASVNRIAQAAEISIGALYKYFATKDELFLYIVAYAAAQITDYVNSILNEDIRLLSKVEKLLRLAQAHSEQEPSLIKLYGLIMADNDEARAAMTAEKIEGITARAYAELLARAQAAGEVRADIDPGILAYMLDNQLINMQLSFACGYYGRRYALFLGEKNARDNEFVINSMMRAIESMLGIQAGDPARP